ncbi:Phosphatidylglycerol/phosphatidylinositol transfer protein [Chytridiales sp. JEL 0842]|nr:Phosphatidylglycerol/phosphatidylinositol transfer protein [Chytridiales sp. JEL 0842]
MKPISISIILPLLLSILSQSTNSASASVVQRKHNKLQYALFEPSSSSDNSILNSPSIEDCGSPSDVFQPTDISISPDPPKRGAPLTVHVSGVLSEDVTDGSVADVKVKLGVIKLLEQRMELCKEIKQIGRECPVEKGDVEIVHTVDIPREVPPGRYSVDVNAYTASQESLACLRIKFRM